MAPAAGFEPATKWLTATYSTAELCRSEKPGRKVEPHVPFPHNVTAFSEKSSKKLRESKKNIPGNSEVQIFFSGI